MAKGTTSTPHDAVFKQFLTQADTARDFLAIHLPPALRQRCDLDTLQLESASFIEESLRAWLRCAVVTQNRVWRGLHLCGYRTSELAGCADGLRLMRYAIAAMQRHLWMVVTRLPLVVPMLFISRATTPYPWSLNWLDCFADPPRSFMLALSAGGYHGDPRR
jgi:predicted transposase YdaD